MRDLTPKRQLSISRRLVEGTLTGWVIGMCGAFAIASSGLPNDHQGALIVYLLSLWLCPVVGAVGSLIRGMIGASLLSAATVYFLFLIICG